MTTRSLVQPDSYDVVVASFASWPRRFCAALLDDAVLAAVTWLALGEDVMPPSLQRRTFADSLAGTTVLRAPFTGLT